MKTSVFVHFFNVFLGYDLDFAGLNACIIIAIIINLVCFEFDFRSIFFLRSCDS